MDRKPPETFGPKSGNERKFGRWKFPALLTQKLPMKEFLMDFVQSSGTRELDLQGKVQ